MSYRPSPRQLFDASSYIGMPYCFWNKYTRRKLVICFLRLKNTNEKCYTPRIILLHSIIKFNVSDGMSKKFTILNIWFSYTSIFFYLYIFLHLLREMLATINFNFITSLKYHYIKKYKSIYWRARQISSLLEFMISFIALKSAGWGWAGKADRGWGWRKVGQPEWLDGTNRSFRIVYFA